MNLHHLILEEIETEIKNRHPDAKIDKKVYTGTHPVHQLHITKIWGSHIEVTCLHSGIYTHLTGKAESDRLFPYEDATGIENTIAHIEDLIEMKPYEWQHPNLETAAGVVEALKEDGYEISWRGYISQYPQGQKIACRQKGTGNTPYIVFISFTRVWICSSDGIALTRFDLYNPNSLKQIANFMKKNHQIPQTLTELLPIQCKIALSIKPSELDNIAWKS